MKQNLTFSPGLPDKLHDLDERLELLQAGVDLLDRVPVVGEDHDPRRHALPLLSLEVLHHHVPQTLHFGMTQDDRRLLLPLFYGSLGRFD